MVVYYVVGGFILFDIVTGLLKAFRAGKLNSTTLREGLFHKIAEILAVVGSHLLEIACEYINLGFELPVMDAVVAYICVMEFVSCIENLCEINPDLKRIFGSYLEKNKN